MERADYMMDVIEDLSNEYLATKCVPANIVGGGDGPQNGFGLRKLPEKKEKVCKCCSGTNHPEGKVRRSRTVCVRCGAGVHAETEDKFNHSNTPTDLMTATSSKPRQPHRPPSSRPLTPNPNHA
ncbi:hypothetical protein J6590_014125 [Homalodisca vitripennis]|nr:hypothetical protein J6590_014125 [Homalodisca vitripennis]